MKKVGEMTVNDGNGLFDNEGLCDSLILDCNNAVKSICSGQYVQFCGTIVQMVKKLANLKDGIKKDMQSMADKVEELKRMNEELNAQISNMSKKDGGN